MASARKRIVAEPGSDLDRALEASDDAPVEIERRGVRYQLIRVLSPEDATDIWAGYDPRKAEQALKAAAGGWAGIVDADDLKEYISERRRTANRPSVAL
jgi:hypothetical protein